MRLALLISLVLPALAGCGDLSNMRATPASSGVTANGDGSPNANGGGAVRSFSGQGSVGRLGSGGSVGTFRGF